MAGRHAHDGRRTLAVPEQLGCVRALVRIPARISRRSGTVAWPRGDMRRAVRWRKSMRYASKVGARQRRVHLGDRDRLLQGAERLVPTERGMRRVGREADPEGERERIGELFRGLVAMVRLTLRRASPPAVERIRQPRTHVGGDGRSLRHDANQQVAEGVTLERKLTRDAAKGDDGEGPKIRACIDRFNALSLLRTHVVRRAEESPRAGVRVELVCDLRDAEVEHLGDFTVFIWHEEHVLGLQVAVHDACRVRAREGTTNPRDDAARLDGIEAAPPTKPHVEGLAFEVLHREIRDVAVRDAVVENLNDVRGTQRRGGFRLALETLADLGLVGRFGVNELHRAGDVERRMLCRPDVAHAAFAEQALEAKTVGDDGALFQFHGVPSPTGLCQKRLPEGISRTGVAVKTSTGRKRAERVRGANRGASGLMGRPRSRREKARRRTPTRTGL